MDKFFKLLKSLYDENNYPAENIYNIDETGISTVPSKHERILARKGAKQVIY